jgi:DNA gyrase subunit A
MDSLPIFEEKEMEDVVPVRLILTRDGYFKRMSVPTRANVAPEEHKLKDGDCIVYAAEAKSNDELVFFTNRCQVYRASVSGFDVVKASSMGDYLPTKLGMDEGERPIYMEIRNTYPENENMVFLFANGKGVRVPVTAYVTKGTRRKLTGAYSDTAPIVAIFCEKEKEPLDILMVSNTDRAILIKSSLIPLKTTRTSSGVQLLTLKKGQVLSAAYVDFEDKFQNAKGYRKLKVPAAGTLLEEKNIDIQQIKIE